MEWEDYVGQILRNKQDIDSLRISLCDGTIYNRIPPIVRASISMLDKMVEKQGLFNIFVFPEKIESIFTFVLAKLYHNIVSGKIKSNYDPTGFEIGEKLKVGNAVVEYRGVEERDGSVCMIIKTADVDKYSAPLEIFPIFQKVATKRRLSKFSLFQSSKNEAIRLMQHGTSREGKLSYVKQMKTHMDKSIFTMTSLGGIRDQLSHCQLNGQRVNDIFYFAQVDYSGKINNISSGQMSGVPAIVFASDLYAINSAVEAEAPIHSIIIDATNMNALSGQLDVLDDLMSLQVPIVCITDVPNSFELEQFQIRGFNVWRWDKDSITDKLYGVTNFESEIKTRNCARQTVKYLETNGNEISSAMQLLAVHRKETEQQSPQMMKIYEKLNRLTFSALRSTIPFSTVDIDLATKTLQDCQESLDEEKVYLSDQIFTDYLTTIENLKSVYRPGFFLKKEKMIKEYLPRCGASEVYLVIPDNGPKKATQDYWTKWTERYAPILTIHVLFPSEYYALPPSADKSITLICAWLKRAVMRKIIYSFSTAQVAVLLYDYETKWQKYDSSKWEKAFRSSSNKTIIEKAFSTATNSISTERFEIDDPGTDTSSSSDELSEIELILHENKFRQYVNKGNRNNNEIVSATPISFVGGFLAFYRNGHKLISATNIILASSDKIEQKLPSEISVGDFIVVREADKDIIRELADIALFNSGKGELRSLALKWREALQIELLFCSIDDLYQKLKAGGCEKGEVTVKRWIEDEDIIAPQSKEDLKIIAKVTENEMLLELLDKVFDAAQEVRKAHVLAGRKLSQQLQLTLAEELKNYGTIDPFNFWEPISMEVEGIGTVKVLKVIDIGSEVEVDLSDTNHLIEE